SWLFTRTLQQQRRKTQLLLFPRLSAVHAAPGFMSIGREDDLHRWAQGQPYIKAGHIRTQLLAPDRHCDSAPRGAIVDRVQQRSSLSAGPYFLPTIRITEQR